MAQISRRYCPVCEEQRPAEWSGPNHGLHFVLTLLTAGLWLWIWLLLALLSGQWICRECGSKCQSSSPSIGRGIATFIFWLLTLAFFVGLAALAWQMNHR